MFDIIIVGGGPAGVTAAIYGVRAGYNVLLLEKLFTGGQAATTFEIENFPGTKLIHGADLALNMDAHVRSLGVDLRYTTVKSVELSGAVKRVATDSETFEGKTVILAMGATRRKLGADNEDRFAGSGVSYCATCDGSFYKDKVCAIVGGGNTALEDAVYLANIARKVYLIHRRSEFRAEEHLQRQVLAEPKIEVLYNKIVVSLQGESALSGAVLRDTVTGDESPLALDGLFVAIGTIPSSELVRGQVAADEAGYIVAGEDCRTDVAGVYAAGDVRTKHIRQIVTAAGDGAVAAKMAGAYISENKGSLWS